MYKLSIITINYNNSEGLKRTLQSVENQSCLEIEHLIIDGGSSDESVAQIQSYEEGIRSIRVDKHTAYPVVSWVSERDGGIYDAMNKGVQKATGEYLLFLNSGDTLASHSSLKEMIDQLDGSDFVIGRVYYSRDGKVEGKSPLMGERDMSMYNMYLRGINHQSALIRRELLIELPYDISVKMGADWKFFMQAIVLGGASVKFVNLLFATFDLSGLSSDTQAIIQERKSLLSTFVPERIARDYMAIAPHYYEVIRINWLLNHPFWYHVYRLWATLGRMIIHDNGYEE